MSATSPSTATLTRRDSDIYCHRFCREFDERGP